MPFLNLNIKFTDKNVTLIFYDKRDSFPFSVVQKPYLSRNASSKMFYALFGLEILRISRGATDSNSFKSSCQALILRMIAQ